MKKYKVKIADTSKLKADQHVNGYLAFCGVVQVYGIGEARKKARMFDGETELVGLSTVVDELRIAQIPERALIDGVVRVLEGREAFRDTDKSLNERMYTADVFVSILNEDNELNRLNKKTKGQLEELAGITAGFNYVQITMV